MPMSKEEREELMDKVMEQPLPPMQELIDKWIKPAPIMDEWLEKEIPEEHRTEGPYDVVGPPLIPDEEAIAAEDETVGPLVEVVLEDEAKEAVRRSLLERHPADLLARVASAAAKLGRKGGG